ncbi:MAG: 4Fe-4S dicluster domain-containing protein [Alphaproteobacteria bacterium]|nr:4Fe-4S dicluster domain-containing protein [Alphaproteobacteria bacterium]
MSSLTGSALDRRSALKLLAAGMAATMARCSRPSEEIVPYVDMPEGLVAGEPMRFATTLTLGGHGRGFVAVAVDGRPVKIEGNARHPFSLGATDIFAEAQVLSLYDPERSGAVAGRGTTWHAFAQAWTRATRDPSGLALFTGRVTSPTTLVQIDALMKRFPGLRRYRSEPIHDDAARAGSRLAFGRVVEALPRWADADAILVLDGDPLGNGPDQLRIARAYSTRRGGKRQRIHVAEPAWTLTGAAADFRIALAPGEVREVARKIANDLGAGLGEPQLSDAARKFATRASAELRAAHGRALVLTGEGQGAELHALCHWMNARLAAPVDAFPSQDPVAGDHVGEMTAFANDLHAGRIRTLLIADANPAYDAPDALHIPAGIAKVPFSAHIGLYVDETAQACTWHLPLSHALESWGDARAPDGTASIVQPLIRPLHQTRTCDEYLAWFATGKPASAHALTRAAWQASDRNWRQMLSDGAVANTAAKPITVSVARVPDLPRAGSGRGLVLRIAPDPSLGDGRHANNAWLQECAKPFTRQVWGNAVQIAPEDAQRLQIADEGTVDVTLDGRTFAAPAVIVPGQAEGVIAVTLGHGRLAAGRIGTAVGARVCGLSFARTLSGAAVAKSADSLPFRSLQAHTRLEGRAEDLFQISGAHEHEPNEPGLDEPPPSILPTPQRGEYAWAMLIDTDACIGCNACVVACQAENNVPVVGPEEVSQGRDMHWLRVDNYALSHNGALRHGFEPVPCMHCELAPCEPVCPVAASVHDHEGLNVQVYNRCIGTRFCEANCPYKVRRFNWFDYSGDQAYAEQGPALEQQHNPDVSARGRGVMEKCNYCLQRVSRARKTAEKESREVADGEMVTACQAACPTRAIHFGNLNDAQSDVSRRRRAPRHYTLLAELNTRPRTTYLKRVFNDGEDT